MITPMSYP